VLLGPPGSGKGTLAALFETRLKLGHLSTGELFRKEISAGSPLGARVRRFVTTGRLVPDQLVVDVMTKQLTDARLRRGIVLDGFPRTVGQAQGLDRYLRRKHRPLDAAMYLTCSLGTLVRRLGGRRVCKRCGAIYHARNMPPKRPGICDRCRGPLMIRTDDQAATIKKRLDVDRRAATPLLAYYRRQGLLYPVLGDGQSEGTYGRAIRLLRRQGWLHDRAQDR